MGFSMFLWKSPYKMVSNDQFSALCRTGKLPAPTKWKYQQISRDHGDMPCKCEIARRMENGHTLKSTFSVIRLFINNYR